ncbi:MAG: hypothetical protein IH577_01815 [Deltaproteobacteria bacterium]|nr:hypothetical protein [Deltaproteobacteria bacterium]
MEAEKKFMRVSGGGVGRPASSLRSRGLRRKRSIAERVGQFVIRQIERMLPKVEVHSSDYSIHDGDLKFLQKLRGAPGQELAHSVLLKRMKMNAVEFQEIVSALERRGDIVVRSRSSTGSGRPGCYYQLALGKEELPPDR